MLIFNHGKELRGRGREEEAYIRERGPHEGLRKGDLLSASRRLNERVKKPERQGAHGLPLQKGKEGPLKSKEEPEDATLGKFSRKKAWATISPPKEQEKRIGQAPSGAGTRPAK